MWSVTLERFSRALRMIGARNPLHLVYSTVFEYLIQDQDNDEPSQGPHILPAAGLQLEPTPTISRATPIQEIVDCLTQHGCKDITPELNFQHCSPHLFAYGGSSMIHKGTLHSGQSVAIKVIEVSGGWGTWNLREKSLKHTAHELYAWSKCSHPNILPALGFVRFKEHILLVSPWRENGSLTHYIARHPQCNRIQLSVELASALADLHDKGIVHGDIKADNVVISDDGRAQLTDFGSAVLLNYLSLCFTGTGFKGTLRFMAPELLEETSDQSTVQADIYALGMTILQIMTGALPYANKKEYTIPLEVVMKRNTPARPDFNGILACETAKHALWHLLTRCWSYAPEGRPTATEVKEKCWPQLVELERLTL